MRNYEEPAAIALVGIMCVGGIIGALLVAATVAYVKGLI